MTYITQKDCSPAMRAALTNNTYRNNFKGSTIRKQLIYVLHHIKNKIYNLFLITQFFNDFNIAKSTTRCAL